MKYLTLLLFLILGLGSEAQNIWGKEGATWHYTRTEEYWPARPRPLLYDYTKVSITHRKTIKDKNCFGMVVEQPDSCNPLYDTLYCYEEGRKLYYYLRNQDIFSPVYDFSLSPGDSFETLSDAGSLMTYLDSLGSIKVGDTTLTIQYVHYSTKNVIDHPLSLFLSHPANEAYNIEGIGNTYNFLPWWFGLCHNLRATNLRCYQNNRLDYHYALEWKGQCDSTYFWEPSSLAEIKTSSLSLFPNPAQNSVRLEGEMDEETQLSIYSTTGKEYLISPVFESRKKISFSVKHLPPGMYMVLVQNQEQQHALCLFIH